MIKKEQLHDLYVEKSKKYKKDLYSLNIHSEKIKCNFDKCNNLAFYGEKYGIKERCIKHKEDMIHHLMVCFCGEGKSSYNIPKNPPMYCKLCKGSFMIRTNAIKKCIGQGGLCPQQSNRKYGVYCAFCFRHQHPNSPIIPIKRIENIIFDFVSSNFDGFIHDKPFIIGLCDCSIRRRIDMRKLINNTLLCIEVDENSHLSYSKVDEENRYNDIYMSFCGKFIFIRLNVGKYTDKNGNKCDFSLEKCLTVLKQEIQTQICRIDADKNHELLEIIHLFY